MGKNQMTFSKALAKAHTQAYITGNAELEELLDVVLREHCKLVGEVAGLKFELDCAMRELTNTKTK